MQPRGSPYRQSIWIHNDHKLMDLRIWKHLKIIIDHGLKIDSTMVFLISSAAPQELREVNTPRTSWTWHNGATDQGSHQRGSVSMLLHIPSIRGYKSDNYVQYVYTQFRHVYLYIHNTYIYKYMYICIYIYTNICIHMSIWKYGYQSHTQSHDSWDDQKTKNSLEYCGMKLSRLSRGSTIVWES